MSNYRHFEFDCIFLCQKLLSQDGMSIVITEGGVNVGNRIWRNSAGTTRSTRENNLYFLIIFLASSPSFQRDFFETPIKVSYAVQLD